MSTTDRLSGGAAEDSGLIDSLFVMAALKSRLEPALTVMKRHFSEEDLTFTVSNEIVILVCSFLDEWKRFCSIGNDNLHVRKTLQLLAPAVRRIKAWPKLDVWRNGVLAHGTRLKDGRLTDVDSFLALGLAPQRPYETLLLGELAVIATAVCITRHGDVCEPATREYLAREKRAPDKGIKSRDEFLIAVREITIEISECDPSLRQQLTYNPWR
ncbi:hypothetical protein [Mesorhizobium amorphae]|uniref:hypothetical protein n=1 Tax=Mesorhizobium amorphae TaxID=71433 RepID=UPI0011820699|nr:hypothetical protein [Mesorhizobium amorphae]